jgi:uncharacterized protein (TIGR03083 family)
MTAVLPPSAASGAMNPAVADARLIAHFDHAEAAPLARAELERFLAVLETLTDEDWCRPTACPLWDVRQVVAHVVGAAAAFTSWSLFRRQADPSVQRPYRARGLSQLDAMNQIQVDDRAGRTPGELIAELRQVGPRAIAIRHRLPGPLRSVRVPLPPLGGWVPVGYLTDVIYTRDLWMHRLDLCRAVDRPMRLEPAHDGRLTALVVRDLGRARAFRAALGPASVLYRLAGPAGGSWRLGRAQQVPDAELTLDALDFHLLASGRHVAQDVRVTVAGDAALAARAVAATTVPY